jgi:RHS repeat-associated protein
VVSPTFSSYDAGWATLNQTYGTNITLTGAWQQWTATYTVPAATAHYGIGFQKLDTSAWWIDDFTITTGTGGTTATTVSAPSGWAPVTTGSAAGVQLTTWSHVVGAADPTSWTFTLSQTARAAGAVSSYTGVDTVTTVDATATGTNVSGVTHTAPSVNTGGANRLGITITAPTVVTSMTPPSGSTERADQAGGATTPTVSVETADFPITVTGASGTKQTVTAVAASSLTATIALRPVSTTGGSGANTTTSVTRFYRAGGATVALRRDGNITWLLGDIQGGIAVSVPNGPGLTGVQRQRYLPYGQRRGANLAASGTNSNDNITTTDHGFLGQVEDNTGLDYLNNRYHDPTLGRFISVDPLVAKTHDAYGYGRNNPITLVDPLGLEEGCGASARGNSCSAGHAEEDKVFKENQALNFLRKKDQKDCGDECARARVVFLGLDGSNRGTKKSVDGNLGKDDIASAAAGSDHIGQVLLDNGINSDVDYWVSMTREIAKILQGSGGRWEALDNDLSWWDNHGADVIKGLSYLSTGLSIASMIGCAWCALGSFAVSAISSGLTCATGNADQCGAALVSTGISALGAGVQKFSPGIQSFAGYTDVEMKVLNTSVGLTGISYDVYGFAGFGPAGPSYVPMANRWV